MIITEVRIKLMEDPSERLQAFCSITFDDCFVIRDLKIIDGSNGPFVAMPSRKLTAHCQKCGSKNHLRASYCNQCGARIKEDRSNREDDGRVKLYADIAHPINTACREMIQTRVIQAYREETERARQPDYISDYDDYDPEDSASMDPSGSHPPKSSWDRESVPPPHVKPTERQTPPSQSHHQGPHLPMNSQQPVHPPPSSVSSQQGSGSPQPEARNSPAGPSNPASNSDPTSAKKSNFGEGII